MKYVFVIPDIDFLYLQYKDFEVIQDGKLVRIDYGFRRFAKLCCKFGAQKIKISYPLFYKYLKRCFSDAGVLSADKNVFILYSRSYEDLREIITSFIRHYYPESKIIVYYGDLISRHICKIDDVKRDTDYIYSFDKDDADLNGVKWLLEPFSSSISEMKEFSQERNKIEWDVTFVGHAKSRYEKIIRMYEILNDYNLKCDFHITGVPKEKQKYVGQIHYEALPFRELLQHVVKSKCIAEVMQDNGVSPTTRYTEAMLFQKNLLTDCKYFETVENRSENIIYVNNVEDIGCKQIEDIVTQNHFDRAEYLEMFSVSKMIEKISKDIK